MPATKRQAVRFTSDTLCAFRGSSDASNLSKTRQDRLHAMQKRIRAPGRLWMTCTEGNVHSAPLLPP